MSGSSYGEFDIVWRSASNVSYPTHQTAADTRRIQFNVSPNQWGWQAEVLDALAHNGPYEEQPNETSQEVISISGISRPPDTLAPSEDEDECPPLVETDSDDEDNFEGDEDLEEDYEFAEDDDLRADKADKAAKADKAHEARLSEDVGDESSREDGGYYGTANGDVYANANDSNGDDGNADTDENADDSADEDIEEDTNDDADDNADNNSDDDSDDDADDFNKDADSATSSGNLDNDDPLICKKHPKLDGK